LRLLLFTGEPFPLRTLRMLRQLKTVRLVNLYGMTEANSFMSYEVQSVPEYAVTIPIGFAGAGARVWHQDQEGRVLGVSEVGELMVEGPTVMTGYWGHPPLAGRYATGDLVRLDASGAYTLLGRRDQRVKLRGFRA